MRKFRHLLTLVVSFVGVFASEASADPPPVEPLSSSFVTQTRAEPRSARCTA
jgi:hypothetical protein